jgi:hypothetical protein
MPLTCIPAQPATAWTGVGAHQDAAHHSIFSQTVTVRVAHSLPFPSFLQQPRQRRNCPWVLLRHCRGHHQHLAPASSCGCHHQPPAARTRAAPCSGWPASPPCAPPARRERDTATRSLSAARTQAQRANTRLKHL